MSAPLTADFYERSHHNPGNHSMDLFRGKLVKVDERRGNFLEDSIYLPEEIITDNILHSIKDGLFLDTFRS